MRKILLLIILQLFSGLQTNNTYALSSSGNISDEIHFSDLKLTYSCNDKKIPRKRPNKNKPKFIHGCLKNRTEKAIYFRATLTFKDNFNTPTAEAKIKQRIPAFGQANFKSSIKLGQGKFSDYKLEWVILGENKWRARPRKKKEKSSHTSSTRELANGLQITGRNSVTTETIQLKKGPCLFTAEIVGTHFSAYLKNKETRRNIKLFPQTGQYMRSEKINIEKDGPFTIRVSTKGSWRIQIEFTAPKKTESETVDIVENDRYIIYLKNGKKIIAEQLTTRTNDVSFISGGTQISMGRDKILKTELYEQAR